MGGVADEAFDVMDALRAGVDKRTTFSFFLWGGYSCSESSFWSLVSVHGMLRGVPSHKSASSSRSAPSCRHRQN